MPRRRGRGRGRCRGRGRGQELGRPERIPHNISTISCEYQRRAAIKATLETISYQRAPGFNYLRELEMKVQEEFQKEIFSPMSVLDYYSVDTDFDLDSKKEVQEKTIQKELMEESHFHGDGRVTTCCHERILVSKKGQMVRVSDPQLLLKRQNPFVGVPKQEEIVQAIYVGYQKVEKCHYLLRVRQTPTIKEIPKPTAIAKPRKRLASKK